MTVEKGRGGELNSYIRFYSQPWHIVPIPLLSVDCLFGLPFLFRIAVYPFRRTFV